MNPGRIGVGKVLTIAGDDTVLIITPNKKSRESLQRKIESHVK